MPGGCARRSSWPPAAARRWRRCMPSSDRITPVAMRRVALVAPQPALRALLVQVAAAGVVEVETPAAPEGLPGPATRALQRLGAGGVAAVVAEQVPDLV